MKSFLLAVCAMISSALFASPEPTKEELKSIDVALETVRGVCADSLSAILSELKVRYPTLNARKSQGRSRLNDYRNYQWISVKIGEREYLITTHHNNLDTRTGNPHTQYGRIQFWKCAGPNGPHTKDEYGIWRFREENTWDKMPALRIWDEDYSAGRVVELFGEFLTAKGEKVEAVTDGVAEVADPPFEERKKADAALASIRPVVSKAMNALYDEILLRHPDWKARRSRGNSKKNDYRNYQWMTVTVDGRMYQIFFQYNDIDLNTGNTHVQFGRMQFWRDINYECGPKVECGPHTKDHGKWMFRHDKMWKEMPRLSLWDDAYSTKHAADLFDEFIKSEN